MKRKELLVVLVLIFLGICIFFYKTFLFRQLPFPGDLLSTTNPFKTESYEGYAPGGYPNKAQGRDVLTQMIPWRKFSVDTVKSGNLPFWDPYNFSGNALIANFQSGIFYPINTIFLFLPFPIAWSVFIMLQPFLAWVFMYLFLRSLSLKKAAAFIGGLAFAFDSYMIVWLEYGNIGHTFLWFPLILFSVTKFLQTKQTRYTVVLFISLVCCFLAGYIQGAFYIFTTSVLYTLVFLLRSKNTKIIAFAEIGFVFLLGVAAMSMQLLPTIYVFTFATRGNYTLSQLHNLLEPWYYVATLFSADFFGNPATRNYFLPITYFERVMYIGVGMLFFALLGIEKVRKWQVTFFAILGVIFFIGCFNLPGIAYIYTIPFPVLSTTVPTRALSVCMFCFIIVSAYGIDWWLEKKKERAYTPFLFGGMYALLLLLVFLHPFFQTIFLANLSVIKHNLFFSTIFASSVLISFYLLRISKKGAVIVLFLLVAIDAFYFFTKFTPFAPVTLFYPQTPVVSYLQQHEGIYRSWGYGSSYIPANYATYFGIYSADGYDPLFVKTYAELLNTSTDGKIHVPLSRTDANIAPGYGPTDLKSNPYRQTILNLLGVKYILNQEDFGDMGNADNETFPPQTYKLIWHSGKWQIYQNLEVFPRFFLATSYKVFSPQKVLSEIYKTDLRHTILLEKTPSLAIDPHATGTARLLSYTPESVTFSVHTTGGMLLFLSDAYYPLQLGKIDGKETQTENADYALRVLEVPKGDHIVTFFYKGRIVFEGMYIGIVSTLIFIGYLLFRKYKK